MNAAPDTSSDYPGPSDLCESCGYALQRLPSQGVCPECGLAVEASDPVHRVGLPWQNRQTPEAWWRTAVMIATGPTGAFRRMRVGGPNAAARLFMFSVAFGVGIGWGVFASWVEGQPPVVAWGLGMVAAKSTVILTYIETLGVAGFSRRRGWRVPFGLAERVACYAAVGWVGAAIVLAVALRVGAAGGLEAAVRGTLGTWHADYRLVAGAILVGVSVLGFEMLVWTGVRQVRYGNQVERG